MTHPDRVLSRCGCVVERHTSGLLRNTYRCGWHQEEVRRNPSDSAQHYVDLGAIGLNGVPQHRKYINELVEALWEMGIDVPRGDGRRVVEIGAGLGMYAPLFLGRGYRYEAVEPVPYAAEWVRSTFNVEVHEVRWGEWYPADGPIAGVMAAHVIEHLDDAPSALATIASWLDSDGVLFMIVPDDQDLWNPEHLWFGDEAAWRRVIEAAGLGRVRCATRRRIERESFLYFVAERP